MIVRVEKSWGVGLGRALPFKSFPAEASPAKEAKHAKRHAHANAGNSFSLEKP